MQWVYKYAKKPLSESYVAEICDIDRYISDRYDIRVTLQETKSGYSIGCYVESIHLGGIGFTQYWHYKLNELSQARSTYNFIKEAARDLEETFNYNHTPLAVLRPMFKSLTSGVDKEHIERTYIPNYNYSLLTQDQPDWRQTLYGLRYPDLDTHTMDEIWNFDNPGEIKKTVETSGSSRQQMYRYKYAQKSASNIFEWIRTNWPFALPLTVFLSWYAASGGGLYDLKNDIESGKPIQEIVQSVQQHKEQPIEGFSLETEKLRPKTVPIVDFPKAEKIEPKTTTMVAPTNIQTKHQTINKNAPRGIRNNNPGNIRWDGKTQWKGMKPTQKDKSFIEFESPEYGIRAMARVLKNYQNKYELNTIEGIVSKWAPPNENDTKSYINSVVKNTGIAKNQKLDLNNADTLTKLIKAIIRHETGQEPYDDATISAGIQLS